MEIKFTCKSGESGTIDLVAAILDETTFRNAYNVLGASTLNLTKFSNTMVKGTIHCNRDGILYTSIPQNGENWKAYVDGKPAEITLIGDCMVGVNLNKGDHEITFVYQNKAFTTGLIISVISLITLIGLWLLFYKPKFQIPRRITGKGKYQK